MAKRRPAGTQAGDDQVGKRIRFDRETFDAVDLLRREQMKDLDEIAEEAFRDLLKKHGRTADLRKALRMSADAGPVTKSAAKKRSTNGRRAAKKLARKKSGGGRNRGS